jgi:hypothetical protein
VEQGLSRNQIIADLSRSAHGKLEEYIPMGKRAAEEQPEFLAHLIAWDKRKGQVRDAQVALPLVGLMVKNYADEFIENSLAHLTLLGPREMLKALHFTFDHVPAGRKRMVRRTLATTLSLREKNWPKWERLMLQHREVLTSIMTLIHWKPADERTSACLHGKHKVDGVTVHLPYPQGGLFELVANLQNLSPIEAAGQIMQRKIPFLIALGALGKNAKDPDLVLALIKAMTATELVTNTKMLERMGIKTNPALRGAFQEALEKAGKSKANLLKASVAAEAMDDEELVGSLQKLQKQQIATHGGIEGDWLVLGDRSPSMSHTVEIAKEVAGTLTALVKGRVVLTFFDSQPQTVDVTGMTLDQIKAKTRHVTAGGSGTSIGAGLQRLLESKTIVDGIAIVSDGEENSSPFFASVYGKYQEFAAKEIPTYFFWTRGGLGTNLQATMQNSGHDIQVFDLRDQTSDYYSLPNLIQSMRTNRFSLIDEILETPLLQLSPEYKAKVGIAA